MKACLVLPLLFLGIAGNATVASAQSMGRFTATGRLTRPRQFHTATLLTNGRVLIAGGGIPGGRLGQYLSGDVTWRSLSSTGRRQ